MEMTKREQSAKDDLYDMSIEVLDMKYLAEMLKDFLLEECNQEKISVGLNDRASAMLTAIINQAEATDAKIEKLWLKV